LVEEEHEVVVTALPLALTSAFEFALREDVAVVSNFVFDDFFATPA
jgi:hypothetical protein